tara:strand:- start:1965 stop:3245 length:1281 start_codon:yes stop_codon:yes gene_type:complete
MIQIYKITTTILYPLLFLFLYIRKIIGKEDTKRFKEKILISHFNVKKKVNSKLIWFHAASIGEFKSIIPIIKELNIYEKNFEFLITSTTLSSGNLAKIELSKFPNAEHRYFPLDVPFLVDKFLNLWKPDKIFFVDSEIWPNLILKTKKYNIPVALINARLTFKSFNRWMMFPTTSKKIFGIFNLFLCSNIETKNNLEKLNLKNIYFKGNIKLIDKIDAGKINNNNEDFLLNNRFWFAASTHKEEDMFCLKTHLELKKKFRDIVTILAPRHVERSNEIYDLCKKLNLNAQILNNNQTILRENEIIIINQFGVLQNYYKYAKSVFIGKSTIKKLQSGGGQNPIEAAKLNCKIYHGPYIYNFEDIYNTLGEINICKKISNFQELSKNLILDLENNRPKGELSNPIKHLEQKTLNDTMTLIKGFLKNENK